MNIITKLFNRPGYTGIKLLVTNYLDSADIKKVYNVGNGAFVHSCLNNTPRYLKQDGTFYNPKFYEVNGDPVSWDTHIGDIKKLQFKEE